MPGEIAYGTACTWWDDLDVATVDVTGTARCPHCGQVASVVAGETWWEAVMVGDPLRVAMLEWGRGRCFPDESALVEAFEGEST